MANQIHKPAGSFALHRHRALRWFQLFLLICAALLVWTPFSRSLAKETFRLEGYVLKDGVMTLKLAGAELVGKVGVSVFDHIPRQAVRSEIENLKRSHEVVNSSVSITLGEEPHANEYSIFIHYGDSYLELVRHSPRWLKETFGHDPSGSVGYTIVGRRTIEIAASDLPPLPPTTMQGTASLSRNVWESASGNASIPELERAKAVLHYLWTQTIPGGPTSMRYDHFLARAFTEKLELLRTGVFSVQCQGMRDLFMHAAKESGQFLETFRPAEVKIDSYSCYKSGCLPGYIDYFRTTRVRPHIITAD